MPSRYRENPGVVVIPIPATTPPKHNLSALEEQAVATLQARVLLQQVAMFSSSG